MSGYDDDRRRRRYARDRSADDYDRQTSYKSSRDYDKKSLVRRDDSVSSVEEVHRDFPPGDKGYYRETTVRKKGRGQMRDDRYDDRHSHSDREYVSKKGSSRSYDDSRSDRRKFSNTTTHLHSSNLLQVIAIADHANTNQNPHPVVRHPPKKTKTAASRQPRSSSHHSGLVASLGEYSVTKIRKTVTLVAEADQSIAVVDLVREVPENEINLLAENKLFRP